MKNFWYCNVCNAQNSVVDGECQFCECGGDGCRRDNCSGPAHRDLQEGWDVTWVRGEDFAAGYPCPPLSMFPADWAAPYAGFGTALRERGILQQPFGRLMEGSKWHGNADAVVTWEQKALNEAIAQRLCCHYGCKCGRAV